MWRLLSLLLLFSKPSPSEIIPALHVQSFADAPVDLPGDLHGRTGVLVIGFSKKSSSQTNQWNDSLLPDYGNDAHVVYYQGAVLAEVPALIRGMVLKSIRNQMPPAERAHFVPILQDASKWKYAAHFSSGDDAYILVIGSGGQIQWRTHGAKTADAYRQLRDHVSEAQKVAP